MSHPVLGDFAPQEIYIYYDGPLCFSLNHKGRLFYCHLMDQDDESQWFFVRECTPLELRKLTSGHTTIRNFLLGGVKSGSLYEAWVSKEAIVMDPLLHVIPEDLPEAGVFLNDTSRKQKANKQGKQS